MRQSGHYSHSGCMNANVERSDEREVTDDQEEEITQLMRDFADWIYDQLCKEDEWLNSDECIDDNIRANEYEFTINGDRA